MVNDEQKKNPPATMPDHAKLFGVIAMDGRNRGVAADTSTVIAAAVCVRCAKTRGKLPGIA